MDEEEREGLDVLCAPRGKKRTNEWKLQGDIFQLNWAAFDEGNEPLVIGGMKKKSRERFS